MLSLSVFSNSIKQDNEDIRCFSVTYRHSYVGTFSHPFLSGTSPFHGDNQKNPFKRNHRIVPNCLVFDVDGS